MESMVLWLAVFAFCSLVLYRIIHPARKPKTILCRKVYKFRMEPTELEALELERTASVARSIYNGGLERCQQYYQQKGKSKP